MSKRFIKSVPKIVPKNCPQKVSSKCQQKVSIKSVNKSAGVGWGGGGEVGRGGGGVTNEKAGNLACDLSANKNPKKKLCLMYIKSPKMNSFPIGGEKSLQILLELIMPPVGLPNKGLGRKALCKMGK